MLVSRCGVIVNINRLKLYISRMTALRLLSYWVLHILVSCSYHNIFLKIENMYNDTPERHSETERAVRNWASGAAALARATCFRSGCSETRFTGSTVYIYTVDNFFIIVSHKIFCIIQFKNSMSIKYKLCEVEKYWLHITDTRLASLSVNVLYSLLHFIECL